jgi:hypothetical protein
MFITLSITDYLALFSSLSKDVILYSVQFTYMFVFVFDINQSGHTDKGRFLA